MANAIVSYGSAASWGQHMPSHLGATRDPMSDTHNNILQRSVWDLSPLFERRHEPPPRLLSSFDLWQGDREQQAHPLRDRVPDLDDFVPCHQHPATVISDIDSKEGRDSPGRPIFTNTFFRTLCCCVGGGIIASAASLLSLAARLAKFV
jgi:hypothetical protein